MLKMVTILCNFIIVLAKSWLIVHVNIFIQCVSITWHHLPYCG